MSSYSCNEIVGYRFHPTDKELIDHYLWNKALGRDSAVQAIGEVVGDLCDWEPGELPRFSVRLSDDQTWHLFCRGKNSKRVKRITKLGFWKLTGKHRKIKAKIGVGTKKTLVFYEGRVPKGRWTPWVIHEYTLPDNLPNQKGFFLCKLKRKDDEKAGISIGEEGQPYNENFSDINLDELLALLGEKNGSTEVEDEVANGSIEVEDEVAFAQRPQVYREQVPFSTAASCFNDSDGVQNQSSTNEQDAIQHQSSTNEQDDNIQHQSSTNEQDNNVQNQSSTNEQHNNVQNQSSTNAQDNNVQNQSSTNEQEDEFWNCIFFNDEDAYLDDRSKELFVGSESFDFVVNNSPTESSRKRSCIDEGGLNDNYKVKRY